MTKKSFRRGFDDLYGFSENPPESVSHAPKKKDYVVRSYQFDESVIERMKLIAHWEHTTMKVIIDEAIKDYISSYIDKNGEIKPIQKRPSRLSNGDIQK